MGPWAHPVAHPSEADSVMGWQRQRWPSVPMRNAKSQLLLFRAESPTCSHSSRRHLLPPYPDPDPREGLARKSVRPRPSPEELCLWGGLHHTNGRAGGPGRDRALHGVPIPTAWTSGRPPAGHVPPVKCLFPEVRPPTTVGSLFHPKLCLRIAFAESPLWCPSSTGILFPSQLSPPRPGLSTAV